MSKFFTIGDIHGRLDMMEEVLQDWNLDNERLILLGDLINVGPDTREVLTYAKQLHDNYGAIILKGNHEYAFQHFLETGQEELIDYTGFNWGPLLHGSRLLLFSQLSGGRHTTLSPKELSDYINHYHSDILPFIQSLKFFHNDKDFFFVHAGVNPKYPDWENTPLVDFTRIRTKESLLYNPFEKPFIFGHTRTGVIRGVASGKSKEESQKLIEDDSPWVSPCGSKLGLDGGNVYGGFLHGAHLDSSKENVLIKSVADDLYRNHTNILLKKTPQ